MNFYVEQKTSGTRQCFLAIGGLILILALMAVLPKSVLPQGGPLPFPWWQHVINFVVGGCLVSLGIWVDWEA